jgi:hypothetical protein
MLIHAINPCVGNGTKYLCLQGHLLTMSASEAAELRASAAEKAALLAAAEERLARLEALHRVAQVPTPAQCYCQPSPNAKYSQTQAASGKC